MRDRLVSLAEALRGASDVRGVAALAGALGYRPTESSDGDAVEVDSAPGCRHVASGGGIAVWALPLDDVSGSAARAACIRAALGRAPRPVLLLAPFADSLAVATGGLDARARMLVVSRAAPSATELETLAELVAGDEGALANLARHARSLGRAALTRRFFREFRARRDVVSKAWSGIDAKARADRDQLALLFLSRIVFLYFLQKQGHLLGRTDYLIGVVRAAAFEQAPGSMFRRLLVPLFFGALNRPPELRPQEARHLGELPYLNGGLFEPHALERAHPELDLPDVVVVDVFDGFFERYRFTTRERSARANLSPRGIQPEMLGRMFEGLMAPDQRGRTGTFYTPAPVVERIVQRSLQAWLAGRTGMDWRAAGMLLREGSPSYAPDGLLDAVRDIRMIDPACGSGAFVLGALQQLVRARVALRDPLPLEAIRRELAVHALHGVDVESDAALLCALRLWLALASNGDASGPVKPLPNLDQRVRQGDALLDPLELAARGDATTEVWKAAALDPGVRRARRCLRARVQRYSSCAAAERSGARRRIAVAEARLARRWVDAALRRLDASRRELHARTRAADLFGQRGAGAPARKALQRMRRARAELRHLRRRLVDSRALPFFSFALHFGPEAAHGSFDLVLSNPPWVRSHRWSRAFASVARARYRVCEGHAWYPGSRARHVAAGQVDLALLFMERGLSLLRAGGVLAMLLPSKSFRSLSAGPARGLVTAESRIVVIEDHALRHRGIFRDADAFAGMLVARATGSEQQSDGDAQVVRVTLTHRSSAPLRFRMRADELPLDRLDARSPWLLVPPDVRRALRAMQAHGMIVGDGPRLRIRRGAMTGANDALLFARAERKLGDAVVAWREAADGQPGASSLLHVDDICPALRGADIRPFRFEPSGFVAWCHDDATAQPRAASRRLARALAPMRARLHARSGWRPGLPDGVLFRIDGTMLRPRVAWRDIATDLEVVPLPGRVQALGTERPLIALNTIYFIALDGDDASLALAALLSALPARVFARAVAERAKDARFRFFAWVIAALPLPKRWSEDGMLRELADLGGRARTTREIDGALQAAIDEISARMLRLSRKHVAALRSFDEWLAGSADRIPVRRSA